MCGVEHFTLLNGVNLNFVSFHPRPDGAERGESKTE